MADGMLQADTGRAPELSRELFARWLRYLDAKPKTVQTYSRAIRQFLRWLISEDIRRPQREDVIRYRDELIAKHKTSTVQGYLAAIKQFFHWTALQGLYPDISLRIKGVKLDKGFKRDYLTSKQCARILQMVDR